MVSVETIHFSRHAAFPASIDRDQQMSEQIDRVRVALVGYGFSGRTFHAPLIKSVSGLQLVAVVSRDPDRVRKELPEVIVEQHLEVGLARDDIDLVVVATPNRTHFPIAAAALNAGKHVVVDKPFTTTLAEARSLAELASARDRILSVFQNRRWDSDFLAAMAILEAGRLGDVVQFESHIDRYRPVVQPRWREQYGQGAGLWYDLGPHLVDQALQLFGLPAAISGRLVRQRVGAEVDDWAHVILDYGRLQVILHASFLAANAAPRFVIHGTRGTWTKRGADVQEDQVRSGMAPGTPGWGEDADAAVFIDGETGQSTELPAPAGDHRRYYIALRDAILGLGPNPVTPIQAIAVMAILETAALPAVDRRAMPLREDERTQWKSR
jgi:predicted dehydrogenase